MVLLNKYQPGVLELKYECRDQMYTILLFALELQSWSSENSTESKSGYNVH